MEEFYAIELKHQINENERLKVFKPLYRESILHQMVIAGFACDEQDKHTYIISDKETLETVYPQWKDKIFKYTIPANITLYPIIPGPDYPHDPSNWRLTKIVKR